MSWEITPNGILYREVFYTPDGVVLEIKKEKKITKEQVDCAKKWLRKERDVVKFLFAPVAQLDRASDF